MIFWSIFEVIPDDVAIEVYLPGYAPRSYPWRSKYCSKNWSPNFVSFAMNCRIFRSVWTHSSWKGKLFLEVWHGGVSQHIHSCLWLILEFNFILFFVNRLFLVGCLMSISFWFANDWLLLPWLDHCCDTNTDQGPGARGIQLNSTTISN